MSIHSRNDDVILQFGLKKPAFRIVVNTPTTHGSIGLTTGLDPAMTLGCGGYGGNITSDNISPRHLLNIKRLAYETDAGRAPRPAADREHAAAGRRRPAAEGAGAASGAGRHRRGAAGAADRPVPGVPRLSAPARHRRWPLTATPPAARTSARRRRGAAAIARTVGTAVEAARFRVRRRRPAGDAAGPQDRRRRANHRHAGGARPRRAAPALRAGRLAALNGSLPLPVEALGLWLTEARPDGILTAPACSGFSLVVGN